MKECRCTYVDGSRMTCLDCVQAAIRAAVAEEREACAQIASDHETVGSSIDQDMIAAAIRARAGKGEA